MVRYLLNIILFFCFWTFNIGPCFSQTHNLAQYYYDLADSLEQIDYKKSIYFLDKTDSILKNAKDRDLSIESLLLRGIVHSTNDNFNASLEALEQARELINETKDSTYFKDYLVNKASVLRFLGNRDSSIYLLKLSLNYIDTSDLRNLEALAKIHYLLATQYNKIKSQEALEYYDSSYKYATILNDSNLLGTIHYNYASIFLKNGDFEKAILECEKSDKFYPSTNLDKRLLYKVWAKCLIAVGRIKEGEDLLLSILKIPNLSNRDKVFTLTTLGDFYKSYDKPLEAIKYLNEGITLCNTEDLYKKKGELYAIIGQTYSKTGNIGKAELNLQRAKEIFFDPKSHTPLDIQVLILEEILKNRLKNTHSEPLFNEYVSYFDSLFTLNKKELESEILIKYQTTQKEAENQLLKKDQELKTLQINRQKNLLWAAFFGLGGLGFGIYMLNKRNRERQAYIDELASKNQKIETLNRETIHRTKNYLNLASSLIAESQSNTDEIPPTKIIEDSKKRLHVLSMINSRLSVSIEDNHININEYLTELIEDLSFSFKRIKGTPIHIHYEIDQLSLDSDRSLYIGLLVNELITNSVKHATVGHEQPLSIDLKFSTSGEKLLLYYSDNGKNINPIPMTKNQGMNLIQNLCTQLNGTISQSLENGYRFSMVME